MLTRVTFQEAKQYSIQNVLKVVFVLAEVRGGRSYGQCATKLLKYKAFEIPNLTYASLAKLTQALTNMGVIDEDLFGAISVAQERLGGRRKRCTKG